jgi:hypothetical protein
MYLTLNEKTNSGTCEIFWHCSKNYLKGSCSKKMKISYIYVGEMYDFEWFFDELIRYGKDPLGKIYDTKKIKKVIRKSLIRLGIGKRNFKKLK